MDALAATSLSETTLTFVINDATQSYVGEEYEQVLLHLYKALKRERSVTAVDPGTKHVVRISSPYS